MPSLRRLLPARFRSDQTIIPVVRLQGSIMAGGSQFRSNLNLASAEEKDKKVIVFLEDVAASGGYMIACAGDEIIADPSSIVGSIGVISAGFGFVGLIDKLGIERRVYTAGQNKSVLDPFRPEKEEDVGHLKDLQLEVHKTFIDLVKERRGAKLADEPELFTGKFWSGVSGLGLGLVDGLGDLRSTLRARYGDKVKLKLVTAPKGLFGRRTPGAAARIDGEMLAGALQQGLNVIEDRALWSRYGL